MESEVDINRAGPYLSSQIVHLAGAGVVVVMPVFVQGLVAVAGLSESQAGFVAGSETVGTMLGAILMMYGIKSFCWRKVIRIGLLAFAVSSVVTLMVSAFAPLMLVRFFAGVAAGVLISTSYTLFSITKNPDRTFGVGIAVSVGYSIVVFAVMPRTFNAYGLSAFYLMLLAMSVIGLVLAGYLPSRRREASSVHAAESTLLSPRTISGAIAVFLYFVTYIMVWTYVFRLAVVSGLDPITVGDRLSISSIFGFFGAIWVTVFSRFGHRYLTTLTAMACGVVAVWMLNSSADLLVFSLTVYAFSFAFNMIHPYLLASMASLDKSGNSIVLATAMQFTGVGLGPWIGAWIVGMSSIHQVANSASAIMLLAAFAYMWAFGGAAADAKLSS